MEAEGRPLILGNAITNRQDGSLLGDAQSKTVLLQPRWTRGPLKLVLLLLRAMTHGLSKKFAVHPRCSHAAPRVRC